MAVTLPPRPKTKPTEAEIEAMIGKGGDVPKLVKSPENDVDPETIRHVSARLNEGIIRQIDALRSRRPRKIGSPKMGISLRDWVVEAVLEKLQRDSAEE
ncbi:hypothetical protein [Fibrella forsythiae]|uniref:Uncharacterized protein n=1 Tax=Fibrella forsythiae TaxID=2817061 RepID=A0ABS3JT29_9BACT|nr:hypothetical protein [Fibrella forsythiae]MBO0953187.1 hypothetical protein [Fibrella forsythiae]